jgi:hypothetical protein
MMVALSWLPFFVWCNDTAVATAVRDSAWLFPVIEVFHLLALAVLGGAVLSVDLRLLGLGVTAVPVSRLAAAVRPWLLSSLAVIFVSGGLLFLSEALKCYENPAFRLKLAFLSLALLFAALVRTRWTREGAAASPATGRLVALVSITLWTGVGIAGRGIGFW